MYSNIFSGSEMPEQIQMYLALSKYGLKQLNLGTGD